MRTFRIGIYCLSSCEGCVVQILNLEEKILELLNYAEIVDCRVLGIQKNEKVDVALVEGFVSNDEEEEKLRKIREKAEILIALGDCACSGGRFLIKDFNNSGIRADPIDKIVKVNYYLWGCPIDKEEFLHLLKDVLHGKKPREVSKTVCSECILYERECLLDKGILCLGPITRGGCHALCIQNGRNCFGCRGLSDDANIEAFIEILREKGITPPEYLFKMMELRRYERENR
ncbi:MAG: NADH:ubiquinone oxidoreductase [Candidatus Njordarchaeales archaeon]